MYINEKTAQLILDAIAWSNQEWVNSLELDWSQDVATAVAAIRNGSTPLNWIGHRMSQPQWLGTISFASAKLVALKAWSVKPRLL